ncbi:hypothetical protein EXIGLDRAFT_796780 [Exidia glandulosa HHB12029]|uniref:Hydrophobin n=1 Tax=Exidia glandulosa HHB12029 TaxID=1314781 RepID=A0A165QGZ3_EXIGL|nr:hypothetical protein EXIGLDRAFT_796780 [Exidia glandulosa HHB12029]
MHFFAALTSLALAATLVVSMPTSDGGAPASGGATCGGSQAFCCNDFSQPVDPSTGDLASVPISVIAGLECTPVSVLSVVIPGTCAQQSVCCQDVGSNGLVNVQCVGLQL